MTELPNSESPFKCQSLQNIISQYIWDLMKMYHWFLNLIFFTFLLFCSSHWELVSFLSKYYSFRVAVLVSGRRLVLRAMIQRQGHQCESLDTRCNSAFTLPFVRWKKVSFSFPLSVQPVVRGKLHWRGCQATRTEEILRGSSVEMLCSRSFSTMVVARNEAGLQSASPMPSGSSCLLELYTSRFDLDHQSMGFMLFKYSTDFGHPVFAF